MSDLTSLAALKDLGAVGMVLVILAVILLRFVGRWSGSAAKSADRWASFLENRDKQASELHLETIKAIMAHTAKMETSQNAIISQVKQSAEEVKAHVTLRTSQLHSNESSTAS